MASTALERIALEVSRVLVISPNDEFRAKVANRVASDSCVVDEATGGAAALAQADECAYATALLDRRLVDLNADEVLTALQKQQPNIRVVFIDSEHQEEVAELLPSEASAPKAERDASKRVLRVDRPANGHAGPIRPSVRRNRCRGMYSADRAMQQVFRMARLVARARYDRADHRRDGNGQGAGRERHSSAERTERRRICCGELRGHPGRASRIRALRPHARGVYRRDSVTPGAHSCVAWRDAVPRRGRRSSAERAGEIAAVSAARRGAEARQPRHFQGGCSRGGGDERGSEAARRAERVPPRSVLPAGGISDSIAEPGDAPGRHCSV